MFFFGKKKEYKLTPIQELMLELLRAQLWLKPVDDIVLPATMQEYDDLMDLGYRQTVICFISAACLRHKDADKIPTEICEEMEAVIEENKKIHEYHNKTIVEVFTLLEENGLHPILLKGQGLAQLYDCVGESCKEQEMPSLEIEHCPLSIEHYQNSVLRQCGDIDIFIGPKDYEKACRIMDDYCGPEAKQNAFYEDQLHYHISNGRVTFEIHRKAADAAKTYRDKEFNSWAYEWLVPEKCDSVIINDRKFLVPTPQYNTLYVFDHLIKHIRCEGVNLRQFCDWMMITNCNFDKVNKDKLFDDLKRYSSLKAWQILGGILVNLLGYNKEFYPYRSWLKSNRLQGYLLYEVINGGNFCANTKLNDTHTDQKRGVKRTIDALRLDYRVSRYISVISERTALYNFVDMTTNRLLANLKRLTR